MLEQPYTQNSALSKPGVLKPVPLVHILFERGGMGDTLARLPAVVYMLRRYPHIQHAKVFLQDFLVQTAWMLLKMEFADDPSRVSVHPVSKIDEHLQADPDNTPGFRTSHKMNPLTTLRTHLTDHAFSVLCDEQPVDPNDKNYLKLSGASLEFGRALCKQALRVKPGKFVVVTTGFTAANRRVEDEQINTLCKYIRSQLSLDVVFLGSTAKSESEGHTQATFSDGIDYRLGIDYRDQTIPFEAACIMSQAACVVGVDNGLLHLAASSDVPIVGGFTSVDPRHRLPYRHGKLGWNYYVVQPEAEKLPCRFCQTQGNLVFDFDWRSCYYGNYACTKSLKTSDWIQAIETAIKNGRVHG